MLKKDNRYKVLRVFFDDPFREGPIKGYGLREISRITKIAPKSVKNYLDEFSDKDSKKFGSSLIIKVISKDKYPIYWAAHANTSFKKLKKIDMLERIYECGLIEYLSDKCMPIVVVLFGSASRGEDILTSDVDLYVQSKEKQLDLTKYENILKRKINIFFNDNFTSLSKELKNNIINGDILYGYLKVY